MSAADSAQQAARLTDPVGHGFGRGMIDGAILGAAVGALIAGGVVTGGGLIAVVIAGCVASGGLAGGQLLKGREKAGGMSHLTTGNIANGSSDVFIGGLPAARAGIDFVQECNGWPMNHFRKSKVPIAEGSSTVIINYMPAARVMSKLVCGAEILEGIENVYIGGATVQQQPMQQQPDLPQIQAPPTQNIAFVNGFLQTQDDSWGAWLERVQNLLTGNGWKTDREVELDKSREFEAKRREAYAWLKAHGVKEEQLSKLTAQQQIDVYEAAKRGESSVTSEGKVITIQPGSPALKDDPYHPDEVSKRVRPPYKANPAHERGPQYNPRKTPEPPDAAEVYEHSVRSHMGTWYGRSPDGKIYRYFSDNAGTVHFSGVVPKSKVPEWVLKELGF